MRATFLICLLLVATPAHAGETLVLGGATHEVTGVTLAILQAAYARLDITVESKMFPSKRSLAEADAGFTDGEINRVGEIASNHPDLIRIDVPVNSFDSVVFSCGKPVHVDGWASLEGLRIGILRGIQYAEIATKGWPNVTIKESYDSLFDLLTMGRLDAVVSSRPEGYWQSRRTNTDCIIVNEPPLTRKLLYHYLHKRHAELVPAITHVLREMADNGELAAIHEKATREYRNSHAE